MASTSIDTRVRSQIATTVSFALGVPARRIQQLTVPEMFVLCQQHGFEVDITLDKPAQLRGEQVAFVAELGIAA